MRRAGCLLLILAGGLRAAPPAQFRPHLIATDLAGGYQVLPLDVNRDGKPDLVALASRMNELVWYENPEWRRHVLASGMSRMINVAACSEDAEGFPVLVVAHGFANRARDSAGVVSVVERQGDVGRPWKVAEIDRLTTSHRLRCADLDGSGRPVVVNAPLTGAAAEPPEFRDRVPLVYYRPGEWRRRRIGEETEGVMHGIAVNDWDSDGRDEILTASFGGIHLYRREGGQWRRFEIAAGDPSPRPKGGASDVAVGRLGRTRFLASIEPWHGHQVAVYLQAGGRWERSVIDDRLVDGHTIAAADLNGDGNDEIIGGYRGGGGGVNVYYARSGSGRDWSRMPLDGRGMAAAACAVADLNADRRPDVVCIGSATANLKWYENVGRGRGQ